MQTPTLDELSRFDPDLPNRLDQEVSPQFRITVASEIDRPAALLQNALTAAKRFDRRHPEKHERYGRVEIEAGAMNVSISALDRAFRVMDALIKACLSRGFAVSFEGRRLLVGSERAAVKIYLSERIVKEVRQSAGRPRSFVFDETIYLPTNDLRIIIGGINTDRKVADKEQSPLEEQLNRVMQHIIRSATERKQWWDEYDKSSRQRSLMLEAEEDRNAKRLERAKLEEEDGRAIGALVRAANLWNQARVLRDYIAAGAEATASEGGPDKAEWSAWALAAAEKIEAGDATVLYWIEKAGAPTDSERAQEAKRFAAAYDIALRLG